MKRLLGLAVAVIGCGGGGEKKQPMIDASSVVDAPDDIDASPLGPVSISIFEGTMPRVGVRVVFQAEDSSVVLDTSTGTDGKASAMMLPGGYVTAIDPYPDQNGVSMTGDVRTFAGVKPGDQLKLFERPAIEDTVTLNIVVPTDADATGYFVSTNCNVDISVPAGTSQISLTGCGATTNVLVYTTDGVERQKQIYRASAALTNGGTIDLGAETYTAIPSVTFNYTNVPAAYTSGSVAVARITALGPIFNSTVAIDQGTATLKVPAISGTVTANTASTFFGPTYTQQLVSEWGVPAATYNLDATGLFLPEFSGAATLDIPNHAVTWSVTGGAAQPDFVHVRALLHRSTPTLAWRWEIVAPAASKAVFPVLPDSSMYNVKTDDFGSFEVRLGKVPGGYDAVRAALLAFESLQDLALGTSGKASFAFLVEPGA